MQLLIVFCVIAAAAALPLELACDFGHLGLGPAPLLYSHAPLVVPEPAAVEVPEVDVTAYSHHVPVHAAVHYATHPVVSGYTAQIVKPAVAHAALAAPILPAAEELVDVAAVRADAAAAPLALDHYLPYALAAAAPLHIPPVIPAGDAPPMEELVQTEKILAPARVAAHVTPHVTHVVPEVTVNKVPVEIPVAEPIPYHAGVAAPHWGYAVHGLQGLSLADCL